VVGKDKRIYYGYAQVGR